MRDLETIPTDTPIDFMREFEHIQDLIEFDGPLLSHFKDDKDQHYLAAFLDCDKNEHGIFVVERWALYPLNEKTIEILIANKITFYDACKHSFDTAKVVIVENQYINENTDILVTSGYIEWSDMPEDYLPNKEVFLNVYDF